MDHLPFWVILILEIVFIFVVFYIFGEYPHYGVDFSFEVVLLFGVVFMCGLSFLGDVLNCKVAFIFGVLLFSVEDDFRKNKTEVESVQLGNT